MLCVSTFAINAKGQTLDWCIEKAKCRTTLTSNLSKNGFEEVVTAFKSLESDIKEIKTEADARKVFSKAVKKLSLRLKILVTRAALRFKTHLSKILLIEDSTKAAQEKITAALKVPADRKQTVATAA